MRSRTKRLRIFRNEILCFPKSRNKIFEQELDTLVLNRLRKSRVLSVGVNGSRPVLHRHVGCCVLP